MLPELCAPLMPYDISEQGDLSLVAAKMNTKAAQLEYALKRGKKLHTLVHTRGPAHSIPGYAARISTSGAQGFPKHDCRA